MIPVSDKTPGHSGETQWVVQVERHCTQRHCTEPITVTLHTVNNQSGMILRLSANEAALIADELQSMWMEEQMTNRAPNKQLNQEQQKELIANYIQWTTWALILETTLEDLIEEIREEHRVFGGNVLSAHRVLSMVDEAEASLKRVQDANSGGTNE